MRVMNDPHIASDNTAYRSQLAPDTLVGEFQVGGEAIRSCHLKFWSFSWR